MKSLKQPKERPVKKGKRGQFILIAVLLIAIMMISIMVVMYGTVTYYRYESWEEYIGVVENVKAGSQQVLRMGLANFTENFHERGVMDKDALNTVLNQWITDLRNAMPGYGLDVGFAKRSKLLTIGNYSRYVTDLIKCYWNYPEALSSVYSEIRINLSMLGLYGYKTETMSYLYVKVDASHVEAAPAQINDINLTVMQEGREEPLPVVDLTAANFNIFRFNCTLGDWTTATITGIIQTSPGKYRLIFENPIEEPYYKWLLITVKDNRGIYVNLLTYTYIEFKVERTAFPSSRSSSEDEIYTLESSIGGDWYWNGEKLNVTSEGETPIMPPFPLIPIKQFRVNVTEAGVDSSYAISPCQYEIWDKKTWHNQTIDVPRGLADPSAVFNASNRLVFQVKFPQLDISQQKVKIYWLDDLDAEPYQGPSDLSYDPNNFIATTNRYKVEFLGVGHTESPAHYPYDYYGVAALLMMDPTTDLCFGPWNLHSFGIHYWSGYRMLGEWRPYGQWQIKYWYGETGARAVVRLIAILNSTQVECVYNYDYPSHEDGPFDNYYDTYAVVFMTANVKYLQLRVHTYWKESHTDEGVWFAAVMGKGVPKSFAYLRYADGVYTSNYDYASPTYEEDENHGSGPPMIPKYWGAHWNENFGRGLIINEEGLECLRSFNASRTRFSITEAAPGGARQGSIEFQALNWPDGPDTINADTSYSYIWAMWMYSGGGYSEVDNYYYMFLESYAPTIILLGG